MKRALRLGLLLLISMLAAGLIIPVILPEAASGISPQSIRDLPGRFIEVNGVSTYVEETGDGAPVVFLHGLYGSTYVWRHTRDALASSGFRAITFDRPGAGLSDKPLKFDYSHANNADFMAALMDVLGVDQAVIVGHSAGGNIAAHFALRYPERTQALVLVDAAVIGANGPPAFIGGLIGIPPIERWVRFGAQQTITEGSIRQTVASFHADPSFVTDADYAAYTRFLETEAWDIGLISLTRDSGENRLSEAVLSTINAPTLIQWGDKDTWTPLANGQRLAELIPQAELVTYQETGHQPMEESWEQFNTDLLAFLVSAAL